MKSCELRVASDEFKNKNLSLSIFSRKKINHFFLLLLILTLNSQLSTRNSNAAFSSDDAGTASAQFLKLGISARADALAGAYSAAGRDWSALFYNPALLGRLPAITMGGTYAVLPGEISYSHGSWASPMDLGCLGLNYSAVNYGSIQGYNDSGFATSAFSPKDQTFTLGWGSLLPWFENILSWGLSAKYLNLKITKEATALAGDIGLHLNAKNINGALVIQNLGTKIKFIDESFKLPLTIRLGGSLALKRPILMTAETSFPIDQTPYLSLGYEQRQWISSTWQAVIRGGISSEGYPNSRRGLEMLRAGVGLILGPIQVDYAYVPFGELGLSHRVSMSYKFSPKERVAREKNSRSPDNKSNSVNQTETAPSSPETLTDQPPGKTLAIVDLMAPETFPPDTLNEINSLFRQTLGKPKGINILNEKFTREFIELTGLNVKICREQTCAKTIAQAFDASQLIIGQIDPSNQGYLVQVWFFDARNNFEPISRKAPAWSLDDLKIIADAMARSFLPTILNKN